MWIVPAAIAVVALISGGRILRPPAYARGTPDVFEPLIQQAALRHAVSPMLIKAVIWKESRFKMFSVGRHHEVGLMQITEGAVIDWKEHFGRHLPRRAVRFDPSLNIEIGTWYLAKAMRDWRDYRSADALALAQYNAGGSRARRWAPENPQEELDLARLERDGFDSTRDYIRQVRNKWHEFEKENAPSG